MSTAIPFPKPGLFGPQEIEEYANQGWPVLQRVKYVLRSGQITSSFTTPITIVPAVANAIIMPEKAFVYKEPGAYTLTNVTSYGFFMSDGAQAMALELNDFLSRSGPAISVFPGPGDTRLWNRFGMANLESYVLFKSTGANPAAGTSTVTIWMTYRVWPNAPLAWG